MSWRSLHALTLPALAVLAACGQAAAPTSEVDGTLAAPESSGAESPEAPSPEAATPESAPPAPAGKRAPCTLGADQTCNDDERVSALWGRCTELGVCECSPGFELNPRGRCQPRAR